MVRRRDPDGYQRLKPDALPRPARWERHSSGRRYRSDIAGEIGMGGPTTFAHSFDNGVVLGDGALFLSDDGRYAACLDARDSSSVTLFDFETGRCRTWRDQDAQARLRSHRGPKHPQLVQHLHSADATQYVNNHGLWLAPNRVPAPTQISLDSPNGKHRLLLQATIDPAALREWEDAADYLEQPLYRLQLDGQWLDIETRAPRGIRWSSAGESLLVPVAADDDAGSHWLWREGSSGVRIDIGWNVGQLLPSGTLTGVREIDSEGITLGFVVGVPSGGGYPQDWLALRSPESYTYGTYPRQWLTGPDEHGRSQFRELPERHESLAVRLTWSEVADPRALGVVESVSGAGHLARFAPMPSARRRFRVEAGRASAIDVALFHLWSDCGRYLVVQPAAGTPPDRFIVLDVETGATLAHDYCIPNLQLHAFEQGCLQVQAPVACVSKRYQFQVFEPTFAPPQPDSHGVSVAHGEQWLLMRSERFRVDAEKRRVVGPLPKWQVLTRPPYPNVAFPFVYRSPDQQRWVHCFGARDEFNDSYDRAQCSRYQACAITNAAACFESLGTAMIWSEDSRYLFLTTRSAPESPRYDPLAWQGFLLDCEAGCVYEPIALGGLAILERFDTAGISLRVMECDWWREDVSTRPLQLAWERLLAQPATPLRQYHELRLGPGAEARAEWRSWWALSQQRAASDEAV